MAQTFRANLGAATFPMIAEDFGQSVILPGADQNLARFLNSQKDLDQDQGIPQLYYCHNVMPFAEGIQSVGFRRIVSGISPSETEFSYVYELRDSDENKAFFVHTLDGRNFISLYPYYNWIETTAIPAAAVVGMVVSTAHVAGTTYIYFANVGCYYYDFTLNILTSVTLTSLTAANILGLTTAYGYLIAYSETEVAWSSTIDPTDFTPSATTGAGSGTIAQAKGKITTCAPTDYGFVVCTTRNAVSAAYTGNSAFPFNFDELHSSGGISASALTTSTSNSATIYAYTTNGLQAFQGNRVDTPYPEITDFVSGKYFEDFDEDTLEFVRTELSDTMLKNVRFISDRYLVISYGMEALTHAIVLDVVLGRLGKLKFTHVDCFEFSVLSPEIAETPKESIAFLQATGAIYVVDFGTSSETHEGIAILGKYQFARGNLLHIHTLELESIRVANNFYAYAFGELKGKEDSTVNTLSVIETTGVTRNYGVDRVLKNHSFICKGSFSLSCLIFTYSGAGTF